MTTEPQSTPKVADTPQKSVAEQFQDALAKKQELSAARHSTGITANKIRGKQNGKTSRNFNRRKGGGK